MVDVTKVIETLTKARDLIGRPGGFVVGTRDNGQGAHCALGALDKVRGYHTNELCAPENIALDAAIPRGNIPRLPEWTEPYARSARIARYNNANDQETVVKWFDRAIQMQREHPMEDA